MEVNKEKQEQKLEHAYVNLLSAYHARVEIAATCFAVIFCWVVITWHHEVLLTLTAGFFL